MAGEYLHPGVYVNEVPPVPRVVGVGVGTAGFVGSAARGPIDAPGLVTNYQQFVDTYGGFYGGSYLEPALRYFFQQGGTRAYISRVVGTGSAVASTNLKNTGVAAAPAQVQSGTSPFNLEPGEALNVLISGGAAQLFTFAATRATLPGSGGTFSSVTGNFTVKFNGGDAQVIAVTGAASLAAAVIQINAQLLGGVAVLNGVNVDLSSDVRGTSSLVQVTAADADITSKLGIPVLTSSAGTGDVANIDAVLASEVVTKLTGLARGTAAVTASNRVSITSTLTGVAITVQIDVTLTTATGLGFDTSVHTGANAAFQDCLQVDAANPGAWGSDVGVYASTWATALTTQLANADTKLIVASVRGVSKGDVVYAYDPATPANQYVGVIWDIDVNNKWLKVLPAVSGLAAPIPSGGVVGSSSSHRLVTASTEALVTTATELDLISTTGINVGARVVISDGTTMTNVVVTSIVGNTIRFAAVTLGLTIASGAVVATQEFNLAVYYRGVFVESFTGLSMEDTDAPDYVGTRLAGETNESVYIEATDLTATPPADWQKIPKAVTNQGLTGGADGATPGDNDYIGSNVDPKSGMYLLDQGLDLNFFAIPGIATVDVHVAMEAYARGRKVVMAIGDAPLYADTATEVYNYRMFNLSLDSQFFALYYPWVVVKDPSVGNQRVAIPPSGHLAGEWANTAITRGVHVSPANVTLAGVVALTHYPTDGEQDILNPVGINCIRAYTGEGIRIMGARTLSNLRDGHQYICVQRLQGFIMSSIQQGNTIATFQPSDPRLWRSIELANGAFLNGIWAQGMLYPSTDQSKAYFVKCDEETNPENLRLQGIVTCQVGFNPPLPAEFVVFNVGIMEGTVTVQVVG